MSYRIETIRRWQKDNPHKMYEYRQKFMSSRKQMSVTLEQWVIDAIDKVKPENQPYGAWVRELVESWAKSQNP